MASRVKQKYNINIMFLLCLVNVNRTFRDMKIRERKIERQNLIFARKLSKIIKGNLNSKPKQINTFMITCVK